METLLYIQASPRIERSYSIAVANEFVDAYNRANPDDTVRKVNLFERELPHFDLTAVDAKYKVMHGREMSEAETMAWDRVIETIDDFKNADKYLFAVPMWNFTIPWRLKQYIDIIVQPGLAFTTDDEGNYQGLITERPAMVVYSRGGEYAPGSATEKYDMQKPYFEQILGFTGFTDIRSITVEPTLGEGPETAKKKREQAIKQAQKLAKEF